MKYWISFSSRLLVCLSVIILISHGCSITDKKVERGYENIQKLNIAVLPIQNLSGSVAPLKEIRELLIARVRSMGINVIEESLLEGYMEKNRIRYSGGIDNKTSLSIKAEIGVDAVLITSLTLYNEYLPPRVSLSSRMVSTGGEPSIMWMDSIGFAGNDFQGLLGLGIITDPVEARVKAVMLLVDSLSGYLSGKVGIYEAPWGGIRFNPKYVYNKNFIKKDNKYKIAVIPFFNDSTRKNAGEIMMLHFVEQLVKQKEFDLVEPGIVREKLLELRIIMDQGISTPQSELLFYTSDIDLILGGRVTDFQDFIGFYGNPIVDFSAMIMERNSRDVVFAAKSYNRGGDYVFLFDWGTINVAEEMASEMIKAVTGLIVTDN
ncbi:MAG: hypothetical protein HZA77_14535 [Candidatus Schekmanbacteria bacterium]|nr:hypothetical protein [Candidatus Schekmanbacteria bacterium]